MSPPSVFVKAFLLLSWFLVIFFLHFVGALVYFFVRRAGRGRITPVR